MLRVRVRLFVWGIQSVSPHCLVRNELRTLRCFLWGIRLVSPYCLVRNGLRTLRCLH